MSDYLVHDLERYGVIEPFGARRRPEEEEQEREREALAAPQRDRLELPIFSVECSDLAAVAHTYADRSRR
jgi:hypothetical protein